MHTAVFCRAEISIKCTLQIYPVRTTTVIEFITFTRMSTNPRLFDAFAPVSREQWLQQIVKDLKGADYTETLTYATDDGILVHPFYTEEDCRHLSTDTPLFTHTGWEICEHISVREEKEANARLLHALNNGATALSLDVSDKVILPALLQDVGLPYIHVLFRVSGDSVVFARKLNDYLHACDWDRSVLQITVDADCIHRALTTGNWRLSKQEDIDCWQEANALLHPFRTIFADTTIYAEAGAPPALQLGYALAHLHEYIGLQASEDNKEMASRIEIAIAIGQDYFFEIAKLRALRKIYAQMAEAYGIYMPLYIHAVTTSRNLTRYDVHNNLLRTTTAAMAAVAGGCNSLTVTPFDAALHEPGDFSLRMARNIQLILQSESYLDKTADVAAGSYFIETLTHELAEKAWQYFTETEAAGGLIACMEKGVVVQAVESYAVAQQKRFAAGKEILVGINKFPHPADNPEITLPEKVPAPEITAFPPLVPSRLAAAAEEMRKKTTG